MSNDFENELILGIVTEGDQEKKFEKVRDDTLNLLKKITKKIDFVKATLEVKDDKPYIYWWYKFYDKKKYIKAKILLSKISMINL